MSSARVYLPTGVKRMVPLTGQRLYTETSDYVDIYLRWRETAVFRLDPP